MDSAAASNSMRPTIMPLGDSALLVRFGSVLDDAANRAALALAGRLAVEQIAGVVEVVPSLISVLVRYDPLAAEPVRLAGEIALRLNGDETARSARAHRVEVAYGGEGGPDLGEVAALLGMGPEAFVAAH